MNNKWRVVFGPSDCRWLITAESEEDAIIQAMGHFVAHYLNKDNFHAMELEESPQIAEQQ